MKKRKKNTVGTVQNSNRQIIERGKMDALTQIKSTNNLKTQHLISWWKTSKILELDKYEFWGKPIHHKYPCCKTATVSEVLFPDIQALIIVMLTLLLRPWGFLDNSHVDSSVTALRLPCSQTFYIIWLSNLLTLIVPDEGY